MLRVRLPRRGRGPFQAHSKLATGLRADHSPVPLRLVQHQPQVLRPPMAEATEAQGSLQMPAPLPEELFDRPIAFPSIQTNSDSDPLLPKTERLLRRYAVELGGQFQ